MVTMNSFDLLGDVDNEDPSQLLELLQQKLKAKKSAAAPVVDNGDSGVARFPSQAGQEQGEGYYDGPRNQGRGGAGRGRGGRVSGYAGSRNSYNNEDTTGYAPNDSEMEKDSRSVYDREQAKSGSRRPIRGGRGNYFFDVPGRSRERRISDRGIYGGNMPSPLDQPHEKQEDLIAEAKVLDADEKGWELNDADAPATEAAKESDVSKTKEEKEAELKEKEAAERRAEEAARRAEEEKMMTLEEYEKVLEEKRKALVAMKAEERKVEVDKELQSMQLLSLKKGKDEIFVKLGSDKEKRKDDADREEKVKKSVSISEFLKPAEGESRNYRSGGGRRGGRGQGDRSADTRGGDGGRNNYQRSSPAAVADFVADDSQFPTLGGGK